MATSTSKATKYTEPRPMRSMSEDKWLKDRNWDLNFLIFSIVLVPIPYLTWIVLGQDSIARQAVNFAIAILIGGPHMVATFSRTTLDSEFRNKYKAFVTSSFAIPFIVIGLALSNMSLLLTVFFSIASIHVIHQIVFITESYNRKERDPSFEARALDGYRYSWKTSLTSPNYLIDFGMVMTALFPWATYRMVQKTFVIGSISLNDSIPSWIEMPWLYITAFTVFGIFTLAFIIKSILEIRSRTLNLPKFIFLASTTVALYIGPTLGNLDTSFQGINVWHSFQYLALTYYANRLRAEHGKLDHSPFFKKMSTKGNLKRFYGFNFLLSAGVGVIILIVFGVLSLVGSLNPSSPYASSSYAFEVSYYIGVLSVLWQHYYHDHFLFTQTDALVP